MALYVFSVSNRHQITGRNATNGFQAGVVQITDHEYEIVLAIRAARSPATD